MKLGLPLTASALTLAMLVSLSATARRAEATAPPARGTQELTVDGAHSSVVFRVNHMNLANFYGRFNSVAGTLTFDEGDPSKNSVEITILADSVDTNSEGRDRHLKGPDFFNAPEFPNITFKSTMVEAAGDGKLSVTGDLTVRGETKSITVDATYVAPVETRQGMKGGFESTFTIDRFDYGVSYGKGALGDEVTLMVALEAAVAE